MLESMSDTADEQRQAAIENGPNLDVAQDLRDVAEWLEQHPELPKVSWAAIRLRQALADDARAALTAVAEALGDRAAERFEYDEVRIVGAFGRVTVTAAASPGALGGVKSTIKYDPIIPLALEVELPISTEELIAEAER